MAKRKRSSRRSKSIAVAPLIPVAGVAIEALSYDSGMGKLNTVSKRLIGYDIQGHKMNLEAAVPFWAGEGVAIVGHKLANRTGLNTYIRKATMGFLSF